MINNQSDRPEKLKPADSERKDIKHPADDQEAVVKPEDRVYKKESPNFGDVAGQRENSDRAPG